MNTKQENVTIAEAIERFRIGRTKLYELIQRGDVEAFKLGRRTLISLASLHAFFERLPRTGDNR